MAGGMAHTETFDPKRYTAFEKGLDSNKVLSTFPSMDTAVDQIKFSAGLERIGRVMDRDLDSQLHSGDPVLFCIRAINFNGTRDTRRRRRTATPHIGAVSPGRWAL